MKQLELDCLIAEWFTARDKAIEAEQQSRDMTRRFSAITERVAKVLLPETVTADKYIFPASNGKMVVAYYETLAGCAKPTLCEHPASRKHND